MRELSASTATAKIQVRKTGCHSTYLAQLTHRTVTAKQPEKRRGAGCHKGRKRREQQNLPVTAETLVTKCGAAPPRYRQLLG